MNDFSMLSPLKNLVTLFKTAFSFWSKDKANIWCAALAYYTVFSLSPLLLIVISIAGIFFGRQAVQGQLMGQLKGLVGEQAATFIQSMIGHTSTPAANSIASIIGIITLIVDAAGVFNQLKEALNHIWFVEQKKRVGIVGILRDKFLNFSMVVVIGFLLMVSFVVSAVVQIIAASFQSILPVTPLLFTLINFLFSLAIITFLFALLFKVLPDVQISWKNVWLGALVTALLFTIGKTLIGLYVGRSSVSSTYGAAASLAVLFIWIYYAAQIVFFGAEFTKAYTLSTQQQIIPSKYGVLTEEAKLRKSSLARLSASQQQDVILGFFGMLVGSFLGETLRLALPETRKKSAKNF